MRLSLMFVIFFCLSGYFVHAQSPDKLSFQAVIRDSTGGLVVNQNVGLRMSILQGSVSGSSVYTETHSTTTNSSGLISIEIGGGTTITGAFSSIDWSNGPYYLKREVDPAGGTNYNISGTSQLMSVPYALHAKTAETVTGGITETDPIYSASEAANIDANDITNLSNLSGTNSGDQDLSTLATKTALSDSIGQVRSEIPSGVQIGDFAQGGIVFWVDETGQHGLVAAKEDQNTGVRWNAGTNGNTQAKGDGPYAGEANTSIIIAAQVANGDDYSTYAARICNELQITEGGTTYGDWYLPSKEELDLMYQNKATIDATAGANGGSGIASDYYWSSTEHNSNIAWTLYFDNGSQNFYGKNSPNRVRAVRAF